MENISEVKLLNSDFTKIGDNVLTRRSTLDLGVRKSISKQKAVGYKIVDMSLLNNILKSVNCSLCNKRRSKIELLKDPAGKNGKNCRRGAVVKGVEDISTIVLVNI